MARALKKILSTASKKKPKKRAISLATLKLGDEPSFIFEPSKAEMVRALNWYTQCMEDTEQHKEWVAEFLSKRGWNSDDIKIITGKIKKLVSTNIFIARMCNLEQPIDIKYDATALKYFENILSKHTEEELDEDGNPIFKVNSVRVNKFAPMILFIEEQFESVKNGSEPESVYTKLVEMGCNASIASQLKQALKFQIEEYLELSKPSVCEEDLEEAYSQLRVPVRRKLGAFVSKLQEDLQSFAKVAKASRKPRKKKPIKVEKLVARVKYKTKDDTYKVASVSPDRIIKASWLWTFNTKYRVLSWFEADEGGLSIKGTTVTNFKASGQKKLRKPEQQLQNFTNGAVKALPKQFAAIKTTEVEANGRLNSDTILLRVFN